MSVKDIISQRGIEEVLHFTTNRGLVGICDSDYIKSRDRLEDSDRLRHIYSPNLDDRKDPDWTSHVSLSIEEINYQFFDFTTEGSGDDDVWWCILSLDSSLLTHDGVVFTTTNNIYFSGVSRSQGEEGIKAMYKDRILQQKRKSGHFYAHRDDDQPLSVPTCLQAEVLYPDQVPVDHLEKVYCRTGGHSDGARQILNTFDLHDITVEVFPERFVE